MVAIAIFLSKEFSGKQSRPTNLPMSDFALDMMQKTSAASRYMYNYQQKYDELLTKYLLNFEGGAVEQHKGILNV